MTPFLGIRACIGLTLFIALAGCKEPETLSQGKQIWQDNCKVCHETGLAGAPVIGDAAAWKKRLTRGKGSLYEHALKGWGDMPAKGGNADLTDDQVRQAVDFMVSKVE